MLSTILQLESYFILPDCGIHLILAVVLVRGDGMKSKKPGDRAF
jgi:hypothetical protein